MGEVVELVKEQPPAWAMKAAERLKWTPYGDPQWLVKFVQCIEEGRFGVRR